MAYQLFIGLLTEGSTDKRFLKEIIEKIFVETAFLCEAEVVIEGVFNEESSKGGFAEMVLAASKKAALKGINVLCVHADADSANDQQVMRYKFGPFFQLAEETNSDSLCKAHVPLVPVTMTEAWMLADKSLLRSQMGATNLSLNDLGLHRPPESYANPKEAISEALRLCQSSKSRRYRRELTIDDLYGEMGQLTPLEKLRNLNSFQKFEESVKSAYRQLGLLR